MRGSREGGREAGREGGRGGGRGGKRVWRLNRCGVTGFGFTVQGLGFIVSAALLHNNADAASSMKRSTPLLLL